MNDADRISSGFCGFHAKRSKWSTAVCNAVGMSVGGVHPPCLRLKWASTCFIIWKGGRRPGTTAIHIRVHIHTGNWMCCYVKIWMTWWKRYEYFERTISSQTYYIAMAGVCVLRTHQPPSHQASYMSFRVWCVECTCERNGNERSAILIFGFNCRIKLMTESCEYISKAMMGGEKDSLAHEHATIRSVSVITRNEFKHNMSLIIIPVTITNRN